MTFEEKTKKFREQSKIVSLYILYLRGKIDEPLYSKREIWKAMQSVLFAANKWQKHREYSHYMQSEKDLSENPT